MKTNANPPDDVHRRKCSALPFWTPPTGLPAAAAKPARVKITTNSPTAASRSKKARQGEEREQGAADVRSELVRLVRPTPQASNRMPRSLRHRSDFVVVMADVYKNHNADVNQRHGNPTCFGLPVLVVLDAEGKVLTTQDTGKLEEGDHHDPAKVLAFLNQWAPSRRSS
jgi:hypothetical protein